MQAVKSCLDKPRRRLQGQVGFAHAAGAGQGEQTRGLHTLGQLRRQVVRKRAFGWLDWGGAS